MHQKLISLVDIIRRHPSYIFLISILFGIFGAFIDALIDYLFFYEEDLIEVFLPSFDSHEFYMRMMLILTLASFSILIVLLLRRINKYDLQLKTVNEHLEEMVEQRTKEFSDLFMQSTYAKALLSRDFNIIETNYAWNKLFNNENSLRSGSSIFSNKNFHSKNVKNNFDLVLKEKKSFRNESIYFEELDKMLMLSIYPITNTNNEVEKIVCNLEDITDKLKWYESDKELATQKITIKTIFDFIEVERARLSNELHDEVGQKLMISKLQLEMLKKECEIYPEKFDEIITLLQNTNGDIKKIVHALHPSELKNYGLVKAIQSRLNHCSRIGKFKSEFKVYGKSKRLNNDSELGIYRIFQEALSNITKHADASNVKMEITFNNKLLSCVIEDDGCGFNMDEILNSEAIVKHGLVSMQERAKIIGGILEIESVPNKGTKVYLEVPVSEGSDE